MIPEVHESFENKVLRTADAFSERHPILNTKENSFQKPTRPKIFGRATYPGIKEFVMDRYGFKVHSAHIAEIEDQYGIKEREHYNFAKKNSRKTPWSAKKEIAIIDMFKYFHMIPAITEKYL